MKDDRSAIPDPVAEGYSQPPLSSKQPEKPDYYLVPEKDHARFPSYHVIREKQALIRGMLDDPQALKLLGVTPERAKLLCEAEIVLLYRPEAKTDRDGYACIYTFPQENRIKIAVSHRMEHDSPENRDWAISHELGHFLKTDDLGYRISYYLHHAGYETIHRALGAVLGDAGISGHLKAGFAALCSDLLYPLRAGLAVLEGYRSRRSEYEADRVADFISGGRMRESIDGLRTAEKTTWTDFLQGQTHPAGPRTIRRTTRPLTAANAR